MGAFHLLGFTLKRSPCLRGDGQDADEILAIESAMWTKRGYKVHVGVAEIPLAKGETSHWASRPNGSHLSFDVLRQLKKRVEHAEYERSRRKREAREIWIKWFTAIAAMGGRAIRRELGSLVSQPVNRSAAPSRVSVTKWTAASSRPIEHPP